MLRLTIVIACLMSLLCFSKVSFQQDPLEAFAINNSCLNGAIYIENKCICLPQYTGINCEILFQFKTIYYSFFNIKSILLSNRND